MHDRVSIPGVFQPLIYLDQAENVLMLMLHERNITWMNETFM